MEHDGFDILWNNPNCFVTVTRKELRKFLLKTGGQALARGILYDVISKHLGAGVYKVSLKRTN